MMKTVIMIGSDLHDETIETGLSHSFHALVVEIPGDQRAPATSVPPLTFVIR